MVTPDAAPQAIVFVHGGVHSGSCWDHTIAALRTLRPNICAFAVDLPGRRGVPGDLASLTREMCIQSISDQISERIGHSGVRLLLVGHSLAGAVIPGLVQNLGAHRVQHIIFVACALPPPGHCVIQTLPFPLRQIARRIVERAPVFTAPPAVARYFFCNRTTPTQREEILNSLCAESSAILTGVTQGELPPTVRKSWILLIHDRALTPRRQRRFIAGLRGVEAVVNINAGHEVMFTHSQELARHIMRLAGA